MRKVLTILTVLACATLHAQTPEPDMTGMQLSAVEWTKQVKMGWNLGNSLESQGGETAWGNPRTTKEMIHAVKEAGFNAIRIPVRWTEQLADANNMVVKEQYLNRVKEVIDWALEEDMYVIINTHHEAWLDRNPFYSKQKENLRKLSALWTSIATFFRDYGEKLAFAGTNETIALVNGQENWGSPTKEYQEVQNSYNQTFVDAVRATGGKNYYRNLVVQTYACNGYYGLAGFTIPNDKVEGRLSVEFHCYDPYEYAGSGSYYYWGDKYKAMGKRTPQSNEKTMTDFFDRIRNTWGKKGLGIVLGEYGVSCHYTNDDKQTQLDNEQYFIKCMVSAARERGFAAFVWDNNVFGNGTEKFGIFKRHQNMAVGNEPVLRGVCEGAETEYKEPENGGQEDIEGGEVFWQGDAMLDWGNGLQLTIPGSEFEKYGKEVRLLLSYQLDYTDYNMLQFFLGDWDQQNKVAFNVAGNSFESQFVPGDLYAVGNGEECVSAISFNENTYNLILQKGLVMQGHGIRLKRVALTLPSRWWQPTSTANGKDEVYTLDGRRVPKNFPKQGVVVKNGKKILIH